MTARIETEMAFLQDEFRGDGLDRLLAVVRSRGRGISALDYLVQDAAGAYLAGEMPAVPALQPGWLTINVPEASEDAGRPERVRALVTRLPGGPLLAVGGRPGPHRGRGRRRSPPHWPGPWEWRPCWAWAAARCSAGHS